MSEATPPPTGRLVGVDLGTVRIGVAVSDSGQRIALAHAVVERSGDAATDRSRLAEVVREVGATGVVVGLPLSLSGARGEAARRALEEIDALRQFLDVPVVAVDERLSTVEATRRRSEAAGERPRSGRARRRRVDDAAAAVLLQRYLDGERVSP